MQTDISYPAWYVAFRNGDLSQFGPLCREPMASKSPLARKVLHLLENEIDPDLEFLLPADPESGQGGQVVKAHRVILAARCRWFYRALLSGMREAIDRYRIVIESISNCITLHCKFTWASGKSPSQIALRRCCPCFFGSFMATI